MCPALATELISPRRRDLLAGFAQRILAQVDDLVDELGLAYRAEIPEYASLTDGDFDTQVLPMSRAAVVAFFSAFVSGQRPGPAELRIFQDSGRARLMMGVPLDSVLHAYRIAGRVTWQRVLATIDAGEETLVGDLAAGWIDFIDQASCIVARGYLDASHERMRHVDARRRELLEALLSATDAADVVAVALRFSTVLAPSYVPVVVAGTAVAGRIDAVLDAAPEGTIGGHRGERLLLLVPEELTSPATLARVSGGIVAYGECSAPGRDLVAAVAQAEQLADIASSEYGDAGVYGPKDLLLEQLMVAAPRLAAVLQSRVGDALAARDPGGVLASTLRTFLSCGSVPETARLEVVHPNTVAYRLARVRQILDLDPRIPRQAALLVLGLGLRPGVT